MTIAQLIREVVTMTSLTICAYSDDEIQSAYSLVCALIEENNNDYDNEIQSAYDVVSASSQNSELLRLIARHIDNDKIQTIVQRVRTLIESEVDTQSFTDVEVYVVCDAITIHQTFSNDLIQIVCDAVSMNLESETDDTKLVSMTARIFIDTLSY